MHVPDGLLSLPVSLSAAGLAAVAVGVACGQSRRALSPRRATTVGVTAAFIFAAQMLNFPVAGGTSGHVVGGVLAAVLVGPAEAVVVMTAVLLLQCLAFGDGGLLALGANVLNMAVLHPIVGFALYRVVAGRGGASGARGAVAVAFASWMATVVAAAACAGELALSGLAPPGVVLPAMVGAHFAIGLGEAVVAVLVTTTLTRLRPDLLRRGAPLGEASVARRGLLGLVAALALALFVSPFACPWPDGLERVVARLGIEPSRARLTLPSPLRGYAVPGLDGTAIGTSIAAFLGTLAVFGVCVVFGRALAPKAAPSDAELQAPKP